MLDKSITFEDYEAMENVIDDEADRLLPPNSAFNPWRIAVSEGAQSIIRDAIQAVEAVEVRKWKRRAPVQETFERTIEAILCDLIHHHVYRRKGDGIYVSRSKQVLIAKPRYRPIAYSKAFPAVLDGLEKAGWINQS